MENLKTLMSKVEGLLFVVGDEGLSVKQLATILIEPEQSIQEVIQLLHTQYVEQQERGIQLKEMAGTYQLISKPELSETIQKLVDNPTTHSLTQASLEVLAIVAYKQPITRLEVEDLRGVKSERSLHTLVSRGLVQEVGRVEGAGRAILYGTTKEFLNYFGLKDLNELPALPEADKTDDDQETDLFMTQFQEVFQEQ